MYRIVISELHCFGSYALPKEHESDGTLVHQMLDFAS